MSTRDKAATVARFLRFRFDVLGAGEMSKRTGGWGREFDDPIELLGGGRLVTLQHAITWLAKEVPQSEHGMKEVQAAAHCVTEAAENSGPMMFARMGMMQAINRHKPVDFDPKRKNPHWGKRKLKRDQ
jgi:hypothetical protein